MHSYFIIYKPFRILSQFSSEGEKKSLKDLFDLPSDVYPVGRLDYDSEGLLILTNDKQLNHRLLNPSFAHEREYWVQVEGSIDQEAIGLLRKGVMISTDGKTFLTKPAKAKLMEVPSLNERDPPIRFRKNIPVTWISLVLTEGKNRQVRKMTAKAGFPTLRLVRYRIASITIDGMKPGDLIVMNKEQIYLLLFGKSPAE